MRVNAIHTLDDYLMRTAIAIERGRQTMPYENMTADEVRLMSEEIEAAVRRHRNLQEVREMVNEAIEEIALLRRQKTPGIDRLVDIGLQLSGLQERDSDVTPAREVDTPPTG